jgi:hypothetical protein
VSDFLADLTRALGETASADVALPAASKNRVLELARLVAHNSERKNTPLATFVIGRFVEARVRAGAPAETALDEAIAAAERLLSDQRA